MLQPASVLSGVLSGTSQDTRMGIGVIMAVFLVAIAAELA